ncbi:LysR family transcriptional regulator [Sneathiella sp.]|jgi:DNA-binding transcriptional LysR family regulator|uniref:LysR family transcriptional regulator n=1 Tax=Sneathiella sp. TaxID=1964365 RepID=UPI0039E6276A
MAENLSITQLRTFLWVATLASFNKTAEKMNTTQPAISSRIAKLEEVLGARLFDRDTGNIQITPAGEALRPHAENIIATAEQLPVIVQGDVSSSGRIQMGITEYAVATWFPEFWESLSTVFPNVELQLHVDASRNLQIGLEKKSLDVAFLMGPVQDHRINNLDFATYKQSWVAAPSTGLRNDLPYNLVDLKKYPLITGAKLSQQYLEVSGHLKKNRLDQLTLFPCNSFVATMELAKQGVGIGILPEHYTDQEVAKGSLIRLTCDWTPAPLVFTGSYTDGPNSELTKKLIGFAKSLI